MYKGQEDTSSTDSDQTANLVRKKAFKSSLKNTSTSLDNKSTPRTTIEKNLVPSLSKKGKLPSDQLDSTKKSAKTVKAENARQTSFYFKQKKGKFVSITKEHFDRSQIAQQAQHDLKERRKLHLQFSLSKLIQSKFSSLVHMIQGFLLGLLVAQALSAYAFNSLNTLLQGYQSLAVPAHAAFNIMFTLSTILAFDNKDRPFLNFLYGIVSFQLPIWSVIIWIAGSAVNLSCIRYDEKIASQSDINLDLSDHYYSELYIWKILVTIRAALTAIGCLLAAKIDKNESLSGFDNSMPTNEE